MEHVYKNAMLMEKIVFKNRIRFARQCYSISDFNITNIENKENFLAGPELFVHYRGNNIGYLVIFFLTTFSQTTFIICGKNTKPSKETFSFPPNIIL